METNTDAIANILLGTEAVAEPTKKLEESQNEKDANEENPDAGQETNEEGLLEEADSESEDDSAESENEPEEGPDTWATALGVDEKQIVVDEKGNLTGINVKVDGKVEKVDIPTLIEGYQTKKHNTQKSQALANDRKQFETVREQVSEGLLKKLDGIDKLTRVLSENLNKEYQSVDWNTLRYQNPAEYAALVQDYQLKQAEIGQIFEVIGKEQQEEQQRREKEWQENKTEYMQGQVERLLELNPSWTNKENLQKAFNEISGLVESYGFTQDEFNAINDHRMIAVLQDALKYRNGKTYADKEVKKPLPKMLKSAGVVTKPTVTKLDKLTKAAKQATGHQKRDLESEAIATLLMGR